MWTNSQILHQLKENNDFISVLDDWINLWFVDLPVSTLFIEFWELISKILHNYFKLYEQSKHTQYIFQKMFDKYSKTIQSHISTKLLHKQDSLNVHYSTF